MRKRVIAAAAASVGLLLALHHPASAMVVTQYEQDFASDASGWFDADDVGSGTVTYNAAAGTATMQGDEESGPFSRFDGYRSTWAGNWMAEIDVYLNPNWPAGTGFDYSVAASNATGGHRRDYIFHVAVDNEGLWIGGSNNTNFEPRGRAGLQVLDVDTAGWYTLQHIFADVAGTLEVTMNVLDAHGATVFTTVRSDATDVIPDTVGGNRYAWFTYINTPGGVEVDNHRLSFVFPTPGVKDDCKDGGFSTFGFENQGQCIASMQAADAD